MTTIGALEAETHLSTLLDRVEQGEEVTITRDGRTIAKLVPAHDFDLKEAVAAVERIKARRSELGQLGQRFPVDEILSFRDEGRR